MWKSDYLLSNQLFDSLKNISFANNYNCCLASEASVPYRNLFLGTEDDLQCSRHTYPSIVLTKHCSKFIVINTSPSCSKVTVSNLGRGPSNLAEVFHGFTHALPKLWGWY
jgi:hypothetical protein